MKGSNSGPLSTPWAGIVVAWCAFAVLSACQTLLTMHAVGAGSGLLRPFLVVSFSWLPWALSTPLIIALARRWPLFGRQLLAALARHVAAFIAISATAEAWSALLRVAFDPWHRRSPARFLDTWSDLLLEQLLMFVVAYALILAVTYVVDSQVKATRLNAELVQAQLAALRGQMDPHFMFNTLNSIASLVTDQRTDAAVSMIVGLSDFLRRASEDSHRAQFTLREEVEYLNRYINIQRVRFGENLRVCVDIPEELLAMHVPSLLLQPLAENAIKHGVSKRRAGGEIRISGIVHGSSLHLSVLNDGPCSEEDLAAAPQRVGLGNLRTRLRILHGDHAELVLRPGIAGGVEVLVTLPLMRA